MNQPRRGGVLASRATVPEVQANTRESHGLARVVIGVLIRTNPVRGAQKLRRKQCDREDVTQHSSASAPRAHGTGGEEARRRPGNLAGSRAATINPPSSERAEYRDSEPAVLAWREVVIPWRQEAPLP